MLKKKLFFLPLMLILALGSLHAKTFKWAYTSDSQSLDPHSVNSGFTLFMLGNVYEGLVRRNAQLQIEPALAEKWELMEPTRWRFFLRKGVTFHNGNAFNADDVLFSFERTKNSDLKTKLIGVTQIIKVDEYTVDFVTDVPKILHTGWNAWYMMDKEWAEANKAVEAENIKKGTENHATRNANGTGPFKVVERQTDVKTVFQNNSTWWDTPTHNLTEVIFTPIASASTRVAALLSGEIDMMYPVPVQDINRVNQTPGTSVLQGPEVRTIFLGFDHFRKELLSSDVKGKNPFQDVRVRKAFYQAIDVKAIKKKIMRNLSEPSSLMISPFLFDEPGKPIARYAYDREASKKLLAEAGYPNGFSVGMDCPNNRYVNDEQICQAVSSMLAKVGIKVNLKTMPKAQYFQKLKNLDTSFYMLGWVPRGLDSHHILDVIMGTRNDQGRGSWNFGDYSNARVDELAKKVLVETDTAQRNQYIKEAYQILHDEVGYIPLHQQALAWGKKDNISLEQSADNAFLLHKVQVN